MSNALHKDLSPSQQQRLQSAIETASYLAPTGYLFSARIVVRGEQYWWILSGEPMDDGVHWLGPSSVTYEEGPRWSFQLDLSLSAPAPLSSIAHILAKQSDDNDVHLPKLIFRGGWCRPPIRGAAIEVTVTGPERRQGDGDE